MLNDEGRRFVGWYLPVRFSEDLEAISVSLSTIYHLDPADPEIMQRIHNAIDRRHKAWSSRPWNRIRAR